MIAPLSFPVTNPEAIVNINLLKVLTQSGEFEIDLISRRRELNYPSANFESYGIHVNSIDIVEGGYYVGIQKMLLLFQTIIRFRAVFGDGRWALRVLKLVEKRIKVNKPVGGIKKEGKDSEING